MTATVAEACVAALLDHGIDTMFGVAGTHTLTLLGAVERRPALRYVTARTEVGAAAMAVGYARATGRPAALLTSTGPGALNAVSELVDARWASLPLLHITTTIGEPTFAGAVHETPEQSELMARVGKDCITVDGGRVAEAVRTAVGRATGLPRGPVTIELRVGTLADAPEPDAAAAPLETGSAGSAEEPAATTIDALLAALVAAEQPVLYVGGGALATDRGRAALRLADHLGAPVVTSYQGRTVANWDHPGYLGPWAGEPGVQTLFAAADLAVVLGSKLSSSGTDQWRLPLPAGYRIDAVSVPHRQYPDLRPVAGDAADVASQLVAGLSARKPWAAERVADIKRSVTTAARERGPVEMGYLDAVASSSATPRLIAGDMTKAAFWAVKYLPSPPGAVHALSSYLAMGTALPMAIGMTVATGEPVLAIVGDGGLQMSIAELATLAELRLPVTILALVDDAYGLLRDNGRLVSGSENVGVALWNPDFHRLAGAYGIDAVTLASAADLADALEKPATAPRLLMITEGFARRW